MGCSFSSVLAIDDEGNSLIPSKAMVVTTDGSLLEYSGGISALEVITAVGKMYTICNSDNLSFDAYPPAMKSNEALVSGQIYFLLPVTELNKRLSGANLAGMAIRANTAMKKTIEKQGRRRRRIRVLPVAEAFDIDVDNSDRNFELRLVAKTTETKKKYKGGVGVRSKRSRRVLSTIFEEVDED